MVAYYNEIDPYAAQWLRNLIAAGHIAPGVVDERSIEDVAPSDLAPFTQCHFFAGVGVWSAAARAAGWPDDRPLWTGSCPCQPFSAAGQGAGFADERHLWPAFEWLIQECKPAVVFGEQVASKDVDPWIDLVCADLEAVGYAVGAVPFPSSGVGAPHIRDRCYWVADSDRSRRQEQRRRWLESKGLAPDSVVGGLADSSGGGVHPQGLAKIVGPQGRVQGETFERQRVRPDVGASCTVVGGLADAQRVGHGEQQRDARSMGGPPSGGERAQPELGRTSQEVGHRSEDGRPGPVNGFWRAADWLGCTDGKWRAVEPGTFPLAHGVAGRMGQVRAYGNAINLEAAKAFMESYLDTERY